MAPFSNENARRVSVGAAPIDAYGMREVVDRIVGWVGTSGLKVGVGINAHVCNLAATDRSFADMLRCIDLGYADGQSVAWASRLLGGGTVERVATTDLVVPLVDTAAELGLRIFFFGGAPGVALRAADRLAGGRPGLKIASHHGYVDEGGIEQLLDEIRVHETDILFVGLGDPRQLAWIYQHRDSLGVPVALTCGGLFDWISGDNKRAPEWMIRGGLEWLWRLVIEPRRLAARYLVGNPQFVIRVGRQWLRSKRMDIQRP